MPSDAPPESGTTLGELIAGALRDALTKPRATHRVTTFELKTYGRKGLRPGVSLDRLHEVLQDEDIAPLGRGRERRRRT